MKGRLFVVAQVVLIFLVATAPIWASPWGAPAVLVWFGWLLASVGLVVVVAALPQLGGAFTPLPEPRDDADLRTTGLYGWVRHPMYSGLLAMSWGWALSHPSWVTVMATVALTLLLVAKIRYEEALLRARFADYADYSARTPRFVPRASRRRPRGG